MSRQDLCGHNIDISRILLMTTKQVFYVTHLFFIMKVMRLHSITFSRIKLWYLIFRTP